MDYAKDISINPDALDVEWLRQPELFLEVSQEAAAARKAMDAAKENVDVVKADIDKEIRAKPYEKKPTEAQIASEVLLHTAVGDAMAQYNKCRYEYDLLTAAVRAFDQRKAALENLVRLLGQEYFAGPAAPRNLGAEMAKAQTARRERVTDAMKERRGGRRG